MGGVFHQLAICCKMDFGEITLIKLIVTTEVLKILNGDIEQFYDE